MRKFKVLDISGDVGLRTFGKSINEAFVNAAIGMYNLITNLSTIKKVKTIDVSIKSQSIEGLFVSWLNELIFYFDAYGFIGKKIEINELIHAANQLASLQAYKLTASITGEDFDLERHESKLLIKAATYHKLRIEKVDNMWEIDVIFDI
ncbi:MAG: archease [Nitrospirota bacterium]|nr:archease [Nitrospirota bacterium]